MKNRNVTGIIGMACIVIAWLFLQSLLCQKQHPPQNTLYNPVDSLHPVSRGMSPSNQIAYLFRQVRDSQYSNYILADTIARKALLLATDAGLKQQQAEACYWLAWLEYQNTNGPYENSITNLQICNSLVTKDDAPFLNARADALLAGIYADRQNFDAAADYLGKAQQEATLILSRPDSAWVCGFISGINAVSSSHNNDQARTRAYLYTSVDLYRKAGDLVRLGRTYEKIAQHYLMNVRFDSAELYFQKGLEMSRNAGFVNGIREAYSNYIDCQLYHFQQSGGEKTWFNHTLALYRQASEELRNNFSCNFPCRLGIAYYQRASFYPGRSAQEQLCLDSANYYYHIALSLAQREHNPDCLDLLAKNISMTCKRSRDCEQIIDTLAACYKRALDKSSTEADAARKSIDSYRQSEAKLRLEQTTREKQNLMIGWTVVLIILGSLTFAFFQRQRVRLLHRELESRIAALRAQMNPHFISNALNAIDSLVNHNRNQEASHYIIQFSRLCRMILNSSRSETISLQEELDTLRYFLNLEQLRMGEYLQYSIQTDPSLNTDSIHIPPMLLQPFVENAIWHGILPKQEPGKVSILINRKDEERYQCIIEDNGIGRTKSRELKSKQLLDQPSWGLTITEERLAAIQKIKGSNIVIEDLFHPDQTSAGTRVTLTLPIHTI